jgi:lactoylglutathione lyase
MELIQVRIIVRDFQAMFRFYRDVIGLCPQTNDDRGPYGKLTFPQGTAAIALQERAHLARTLDDLGDRGDATLIAIRVPAVVELVGSIQGRGGRFLREPELLWGRMRAAYLRDPEGNILEFQEWL